ncbi:alpha/beta hydrolase [Bradyrhizobium sp. CSA112]|uniref:alpha/beta fold hydrolase n=1 Tax=Bradyrhizobium sp. CSA112 TaxID=2699170 RepID=UPI0023B0BEAC|nr:alpha/beta hydrolase [Bradyrhizobium sp. CSA112]
MHVSVNGVRLFFDVEGAKFVPDGPVMREKPVLLMLHGGPGFDHSIYRPAYSALADIAQVVYLDHRGNGRSEDGPRESWNLAQWGDDVRGFCDALGIVDPIVLGASFGGMVALSYATRHPAHPSRLILISTAAAGHEYLERRAELFERFGGPEVGALARRRLLEQRGHPDQASVAAWARLAMPHYTRVPRDPDMARRAINRPEVLQWFTRPGGESHSYNFFPASIASSARRWCSAAKTTPFTRSRARQTSPPPCRRISFGSRGLPTAGTPAYKTHLSTRWQRSAASS